MATRKPGLPAAWYPRGAAEIRRFIEEALTAKPEADALAVVAPHAGWAFSGRLAALAWASLAPVETVVVIGGHLGRGDPLLYAPETSFETPLGELRADAELLSVLLDELGDRLPVAEDRRADNTVEVQLPFAAYLHPASSVLWLRAPASPASLALGLALDRAATRLGRGVALLASTDLTHYGPDYGFEPPEAKDDPGAWLRLVNDRAYLDAVIALDGPGSLERARLDRSACSAGAVAAAIAFAQARLLRRSRLLGYATSADIRPGPSLVGYAALAFCP